MPASATATIPQFLLTLAEDDSEFKDLKPKHVKTTYAMFEYMRNQLKNSMVKIKKEIKDGKIVPGPQNHGPNHDNRSQENS